MLWYWTFLRKINTNVFKITRQPCLTPEGVSVPWSNDHLATKQSCSLILRDSDILNLEITNYKKVLKDLMVNIFIASHGMYHVIVQPCCLTLCFEVNQWAVSPPNWLLTWNQNSLFLKSHNIKQNMDLSQQDCKDIRLI